MKVHEAPQSWTLNLEAWPFFFACHAISILSLLHEIVWQTLISHVSLYPSLPHSWPWLSSQTRVSWKFWKQPPWHLRLLFFFWLLSLQRVLMTTKTSEKASLATTKQKKTQFLKIEGHGYLLPRWQFNTSDSMSCVHTRINSSLSSTIIIAQGHCKRTLLGAKSRPRIDGKT